MEKRGGIRMSEGSDGNTNSSSDMSYLWAVVQMVEDTITFHIQ